MKASLLSSSLRPGKTSTVLRQALALSLEAGAMLCAAYTFWIFDAQYLLPTPKPGGLVQVPLGSRMPLLPGVRPNSAGKPVLLHFLNAACPCTRFNIDHVRGLYQSFGNQVQFLAVYQYAADARTAAREYERLNLPLPVVLDAGGEDRRRLRRL